MGEKRKRWRKKKERTDIEDMASVTGSPEEQADDADLDDVTYHQKKGKRRGHRDTKSDE